MLVIQVNASDAIAKTKNASAYTKGFGDGVPLGLPLLLNRIGVTVVEMIGLFLDSMAAGNKMALHHIYEWGQLGSAGGRLFDFSYAVGGNTVSFSGNLTQSSSIAPTANRPFYNKAEVMETGQAVTIEPVDAEVLAFNGIFHPGPITVTRPGGGQTVGQFQRYSDIFFSRYLTQAFLAPLLRDLSTAEEFPANWAAGVNGGGYGTGVRAGKNYLANAEIGGIAI